MAYEFEFITDSRFGGTKTKLKSMDKRLRRDIQKLKGVTLKIIRPLYELDWAGAEPSKQWRMTYIISKNTRDITWNKVIGVINKIKPVYYKRI